MKKSAALLILVVLGCGESHLAPGDGGSPDDARADAPSTADASSPDAAPVEGGCRPPSRWVGSSPVTLAAFEDRFDDFMTPTRAPLELVTRADGQLFAVWTEGDFGAIDVIHAQPIARDGRTAGARADVRLDHFFPSGRGPRVAATPTGFVAVYCEFFEAEGTYQQTAISLDPAWQPVGRRAVSPFGSCPAFVLAHRAGSTEPHFVVADGRSGGVTLFVERSLETGARGDGYGSTPEGDIQDMRWAVNGENILVLAGLQQPFVPGGGVPNTLTVAMTAGPLGPREPARVITSEGTARTELDGGLVSFVVTARGDGYRALGTGAAGARLLRIDLDETGGFLGAGDPGLGRPTGFAAEQIGPDTVGVMTGDDAGGTTPFFRLFALDASGTLVVAQDVAAPDERSHGLVVSRAVEQDLLVVYEAHLDDIRRETRIRLFECVPEP